MVDGLRICLKAKLDRSNRKTNEKDDCPGTFIEDHDLAQNKKAGIIWLEIDRINDKMKEFKAEMIGTMREEMQKYEENMITKLKEK